MVFKSKTVVLWPVVKMVVSLQSIWIRQYLTLNSLEIMRRSDFMRVKHVITYIAQNGHQVVPVE